MSTSKRHHEIPQMLSRNFVDKDDLLHCYRKEDDRAFKATPANVLVRHGFYSKRGGDGTHGDASKEQALAVDIEGPAKPVIEKIVRRVRARQLPELSREEKCVWDLFVYVQCRRTTAALHDLEESNLVQWAIDAVEKIAGPLSKEERAEVDGSTERRRAAVREAWLDTLTLPSGDDPIIPMIPPGATLNHTDAATIFPIARDVAVVCEGDSLDEVLGLLPKGSDGARLLRNINLANLEQSSTVAGPSERLIESLTRGGR